VNAKKIAENHDAGEKVERERLYVSRKKSESPKVIGVVMGGFRQNRRVPTIEGPNKGGGKSKKGK